MAQRRMLSKKITDTDTFLDMPLSTQALYFHLNMHADDDGFVSNVRTINRMIGGSEDDLKILMAKQFIFTFDSGVVVIRDWKIHNYIRKDTYNSTIYKNEKTQLGENENGSYTLRGRAVDEPSPQVRLGKDRLGKDSKTIDQVQKPNRDRTSHLENDFDKLWSLYPTGRKQGRKKAFAAYQRAIKNGTTNKQIQDGIVNYKKEIKIQKTPINYIKQGSTWFFNECWSDEFNFTPPVQKRNGREVVQKETLPDWAKEDHVEEEKPNDEDKSSRIAELMKQINKKE